MKRFLGYGLLGALAFLLSLLWLAPATLITDTLSARLPGFSAQRIEGRAVHGAAQGVHWRKAQIERLEWRWQPLALLNGTIGFRLKVADPDLQASVSAAINRERRWRLLDALGDLSLTRVSALAGFAQWPLQGRLEFNLRHLELNPVGLPLTAEGVVELRDVRITLKQPLNLGDFTVQLTPNSPEGVRATVKDRGGPLALDGTASLLPDGRYQFSGSVALRNADDPALRQALGLLGPPGSDGRHALNFSGVLKR